MIVFYFDIGKEGFKIGRIFFLVIKWMRLLLREIRVGGGGQVVSGGEEDGDELVSCLVEFDIVVEVVRFMGLQ